MAQAVRSFRTRTSNDKLWHDENVPEPLQARSVSVTLRKAMNGGQGLTGTAERHPNLTLGMSPRC